ncbi:MAG: GIY-YIG nuclease family protein, partial [Candidatus Aenigmarchaeota archaeon]|nr:GIY-YIG nuclease family protein [Candidatus Aenigmarchaeota archaeon]
NNHFYIGQTNDFFRRMEEHENGEGSKFTKKYHPIEVLYVEPCDSREYALNRENELTLELLSCTNDFDKIAGGKYAQLYKPDFIKQRIKKKIMEP